MNRWISTGWIALALAVGIAAAPVLAKPKLARTPPPAGARRAASPRPPGEAAGLRGPARVETLALRDVLSPPQPPSPPAGPKAPPLPRPPSFGLKLGADLGGQCRTRCAEARYQCLIEPNAACDSAWSQCVIDCNLPKPR